MTEEFSTENQQTQDQNQSTNLSTPDDQNKKYVILSIVAIFIIVALVVLAAIFLLRAPEETTAKNRDVFIIFMALEMPWWTWNMR